MSEQMEERFIEVFIGPQHPGSGHMRLILKMDGDIIVDVDPDIGYVHRTIEKLSEVKTYVQVIPLIERPVIADAFNITLGYVLALEKLLGVEAPPRAQYLRTLMAELNRIASHLYGIGIHGIMVGSSTAFMWAFGDREVFVELMQKVAGARTTYSYPIPGGVRRDIPENFKDDVEKALKYIEKRVEDYFAIFVENPVTYARLKDVGVIKREDAAKIGIVGPNLRASGIPYDVRKDEPYCAYQEIDFKIAFRTEGDSYARLLVRFDEIRNSAEIIRQVLDKLPSGPILTENYAKRLVGFKKELLKKGVVRLPTFFVTLRPPEGEAVSRVECGRGEVLYYLISDGSSRPYRMRLVTPSFRNVIAFKYALRGHRLADLPAVYGSLDYFPPEADR